MNATADWAAKVHATHVRLGITMGNCAECTKDTRPEWVRRMQAKDFTGAIRAGTGR